MKTSKMQNPTTNTQEALKQVDQTKEYLRSKDVARIFSISNSTLKNLRSSGTLPCYKLGGTYLYKRSEIEATLEKL